MKLTYNQRWQNILLNVRKISKIGQDYAILYKTKTAKVTVNSPNFLVWKFCGKAQVPHSLGRFARNYAEIVPFHKFPYQEIR